jgi:hypothetical protein
MRDNDVGASELLDETLIIAMGLVLAVVVAVLVFGVFKPVDKSAYLVPQFGVGNASGHTVITIYNRGGDLIDFNVSPQAKYQAVLYVDTPSGSFRAVPASPLTVFRPGDTIYAYYTGSGFVLTNTLSGVTFPSLPGGKISVKIVDTTSGTLISQADLILAATTPTSTATPTATATPITTTPATTATTPVTTVTTTATTTATTTITTAVTTTTPTPTKTCPPHNPHCNDCPWWWPLC